MEKPIVSTSPHIRHCDTTSGIMLDVIIALMPALIAGVAFFGTRALINLTVCVVTAVLAEYLCCLVMKKPSSIGDLSAVVTGLLLGLNLPASLPFWMGALGSAIAVIIIKQMFGGLGQNFVNPAITARIVLMVSFPTAMTTWIAPLTRNLDAVSSPTPMADSSLYSLKDLALGIHPGCIGETCSVLLLAGGVYLIFRKVIRPTIPLCFIGTVGALTLIASLTTGKADSAVFDALYSMMSGGLLLGAIFMATDYVTSPSNFKGQLIFGIGCGLFTFLIRYFGALPEGVSFAIILMNILTPHINKLTAPKPFGWEACAHE